MNANPLCFRRTPGHTFGVHWNATYGIRQTECILKRSARLRTKIIPCASTAASSPDPDHQKHLIASETNTSATQRLLIKVVRRIVSMVLGATLLAVTSLAIAPYLLSNPNGLRAAVGAANVVAASRAHISIHLESLSAGWARPIDVRGLRIESTLVKNSHEKTAQGPLSLFREQSANRRGQGSHNDPSSTQMNSNGEDSTSMPLFVAQRVRTTASLWHVLWGHPSDVLVSTPVIDAVSKDPRSGNLRILQVLQDIGWAPPPVDATLLNKTTSPAVLEDVSASATVREHQRQPGGVAGGGETEDSGPQRAYIPSSSVPFAGEIRDGNVHVALSEGTLHVPQEVGNVMMAGDGHGLHFEALRGASAIKDDAIDSLDDVDAVQATAWVDSPPDLTIEMPSDEAPLSMRSLSDCRGTLINLLGGFKAPVKLRVDAPSFKTTISGWQTTRGYTVLAKPIETDVHLTADTASVVLKRLNPLLGRVVTLHTDSHITASVSPYGGVWPSSTVSLRLSPVRLTIRRGPALGDALKVLELLDGGVARAAQAATLEVGLTPLVANVDLRSGVIRTGRVDISVRMPGVSPSSSPRSTLRMVSWGQAHMMSSGRIDMTLAIPADTLATFGMQGVPHGCEGVPIEVGGTVDAPRLNVWRASKDMALLMLQSKAKDLGPRTPAWLLEELVLGGEPSRFKLPQLGEVHGTSREEKIDDA